VTCHECGAALTGKQLRWCSVRCQFKHVDRERYPARKAVRKRPGPGKGRGTHITDAKLAEVKARFPSCARPWDLGMVEKAWPRLSVLLPRRLERLK
jgi:hypothetical protein